MDFGTKLVFGALFGVALISAFAYATPYSDRQNLFSWMTGWNQQGTQNGGFGMGMVGNGGFRMMGDWQDSQDGDFGMMGQQAGNGFNFSAMHGRNSFGMMGGNRSFRVPGNGGFGMMGAGFRNGTGFNSSAMRIIHNQMHGTNLTAEEFADLHGGFNASITNSSSFGCPMHSGKFGDVDSDEDEQDGNSNRMASHHAAMHGGNGFGMMGGRRS